MTHLFELFLFGMILYSAIVRENNLCALRNDSEGQICHVYHTILHKGHMSGQQDLHDS